MNLEELKTVSEKFHKEVTDFNKDFITLFNKWAKKDVKVAVFGIVHLPINIMMNAFNDEIAKCMPYYPESMERMTTPIVMLKDLWGKVPMKMFVEKYQKIYESQFERLEVPEISKEKFEEWYEHTD